MTSEPPSSATFFAAIFLFLPLASIAACELKRFGFDKGKAKNGQHLTAQPL
jgi:hypothetical protein